MQKSYENLKKGQLELVEMNKNLIVKHQQESQDISEQLKAA